MKFIADLQIHSKYSRATSKEMVLEEIDRWAGNKGMLVMGTGDFTHPAWFKEIKEKLEPKSPNYEDRIKSINFLLENNVDVIPYFSPIIPWVSNTQRVFSFFPKAETIEFEGLNFRLGNIKQIIDIIALSFPNLGNSCERLINDKIFYEAFWLSVKKNISSEAEKIKKRFNIYIHKPAGFFENSYLSIAQ